MTERFTITQDFEEHHRQIRDNGKIIRGCFLEPQAEPIVKLLNELHEENKELKTLKDKVFALIDAKIEIHKHKPFMAPVSAPMSVNFDEDTDRLARWSELEQLKEELSE